MQTCSTASGGVYFVEETIKRKECKKPVNYSELSEKSDSLDAAVLVQSGQQENARQITAAHGVAA